MPNSPPTLDQCNEVLSYCLSHGFSCALRLDPEPARHRYIVILRRGSVGSAQFAEFCGRSQSSILDAFRDCLEQMQNFATLELPNPGEH